MPVHRFNSWVFSNLHPDDANEIDRLLKARCADYAHEPSEYRDPFSRFVRCRWCDAEIRRDVQMDSVNWDWPKSGSRRLTPGAEPARVRVR